MGGRKDSYGKQQRGCCVVRSLSHQTGPPGQRGLPGGFRLLERSDVAAEQAFADLIERFPDDPLARFQLQRLRAGERKTTILLEDK